jgi:hypothetical protein
MVKFRQATLGVLAAAAVAILPMAPAMADGHGYRGGHGFGVGRGLLGAAVALVTLPLVVASNVVAGVSEAVAPASPGYAAPAYGYAPAYSYAPPVAYERPYYAPYQGYYGAPRGAYVPRPYYGRRGYYRAGGYPYQRR